jgi:hypothetical protein
MINAETRRRGDTEKDGISRVVNNS